MVPELLDGRPSDEKLLPYIVDTLSFLIVMPDDPELEYLSLFSGVYMAICTFRWYVMLIKNRNPKNGGFHQISALVDCM